MGSCLLPLRPRPRTRGGVRRVTITLSRAEIAELTRTPQRRRQVDFLQRNGIRHFIDQYGWPVVTRAAATK